MFVAENVLRESEERQTTSCNVPTQCMNKQLEIASDEIFFLSGEYKSKNEFSLPLFFSLFLCSIIDNDNESRW